MRSRVLLSSAEALAEEAGRQMRNGHGHQKRDGDDDDAESDRPGAEGIGGIPRPPSPRPARDERDCGGPPAQATDGTA